MVLEFLGADREVTGSCHYLTFEDKHFVVDCGMEQGADLYVNQEIPVNPSLLDYVFVTHAHIDHSGLIPLLYKNGFRGKIFATKATTELCHIMLKDSAHIQEFEAEWRNRKARRSGAEEIVPMYTVEDATAVMEQFVPVDYHARINICEGLDVRFVDAGHLLGSSSIEIWITEGGQTRKLLFSGDIGNGNRPLIKDPEYVTEADYVIMESTYGNRIHETPPDYAVELAKVMNATFTRGGNLVIPAFSVGRTQEMLYFIRRIKTEGLLNEFPNFEVYVDSPLSAEATNVFHSNVRDCFNEQALELERKGINPLQFPGLRISVTSDDSRNINFDPNPKVILSASGMCEAGRIRHHLKHNLWRPECTILFVGYQVPGTLGYHLLDGAKKVRLFGEEIEVRANIVKLPGISGHADRNHLTTWISKVEHPQKVFVVHGEEETAVSFADHVRAELGLDSYAPYSGDAFDLITGAQIREGSREYVVKKQEQKRIYSTKNSVYYRLESEGERLNAVIKKCQGMANKDLAKFADQIHALAEKWDR
ncbi:MBL fold metallo-hydrolase RNA specificity domain-containing protein [Agathobacter ruminis]|uniref:MBL fold hydrolase n=1 Tax=Agathobacter ruminis TaxID=1712665 RepID=A0A2G3DZS9_9FIRM|nr:MBL fold metallo-hydrolase [Agathobacter ruminis]MDC7300669.1 MBL fold metallo-hydrolase [Agathobacter ruminis]PHU36395.1 MBL fold hydrolase [Agathobacter ruminis]